MYQRSLGVLAQAGGSAFMAEINDYSNFRNYLRGVHTVFQVQDFC